MKNINKILIVFLILFCLIFVFSVVASSIISADIFHDKYCHKDDCEICRIIHIANQFSKTIGYLSEYIIILNVSICFIYIYKMKSNERIKDTLVSLNIILNE